MLRRIRPSALAAFIALNAFGCSDSSESTPVDAGGDQEASPPPGTATSVRFEPAETLTLTPGAQHLLAVVVDPPGEHRVRFSLLGEALDASLEADLLLTGPDGRAGTRIVAPQSATTFSVRAVADDGPSAEIAVSVSGTGFGSLLVVPVYAGRRTIEGWVVSAAALTTCAEKKGIPPADGPLWTAGTSVPILLDDVPAGTPLAITARFANAAGGCADHAKLASGAKETVKITVSDRPIRLENTDALVSMLLAPDGSALNPWLGQSTASFVRAFSDSKPDESALLDEMEGVLSAPAEFAEAREANDWDSKLREYLHAKGKLPTERVREWIAKGTMPLQAGVILDARVQGQDAAPSHPTLTVIGFGGIEAADVFPVSDHALTLSADPGDTIHLGGSVFLLPSRLMARAAESAAVSTAGEAPVGALQKAIECDELSIAIESWSEPLKSCGEACLTLACNQAVERMWARAQELSTATFSAAGLTFTIAADATVDGDANLATFDGTWAGELSEGAQAISVKGTVLGRGTP